MKAPAVDYVRPRSLTQAVGLLAHASVEARVIAGGQSLMAMMNLRLALAGLLIDIARLPELMSATDDAECRDPRRLRNACRDRGRACPDPSRGLMPRVAATLAYRAIRNRGTIGGSLALADPAAEWPAVLTALDAEVTLCSPNGRRSLKCAEFATGIFETRLAADEIIESVRVPKLSADARWGYLKLCRKSGEFANALAVVVADPARDYTRVVTGAANGAPLVLDEASSARCCGRRSRPEPCAAPSAADLDRAADRHFDEFQRNLHHRRRNARGATGAGMTTIRLHLNGSCHCRRRAGAVVARRFSARTAQSDRHPSRLRAWRLRGMHGPRRRRAGALVPDARRRLRRPRRRDDRGLRRRSDHGGVAHGISISITRCNAGSVRRRC